MSPFATRAPITWVRRSAENILTILQCCQSGWVTCTRVLLLTTENHARPTHNTALQPSDRRAALSVFVGVLSRRSRLSAIPLAGRESEMNNEDKSALSYARSWVRRSPGPDAWSNLAAVYATKEPPDLKRARSWYRRAALKGHDRGLFEYGLML